MAVPKPILDFFQNEDLPTPYLLIDLEGVKKNYRKLCSIMPDARHYYAIKANPDSKVLELLVALGGYFEVASIGEIDACLKAGAPVEKILYGNPLKKEKEVATAYKKGIREFVFDDHAELLKISRAAPGSKVICRIIADGKGAVSPLTVKFGALAEKAENWLKEAPALGLIPFGVSFHTGSQQLVPESWEKPIMDASKIFTALEEAGHPLTVLDIGGGFPVTYRSKTPRIHDFALAIEAFIQRHFARPPLVYTEPGRYMCGNAGHILSEVVQVREDHEDKDTRWVYLDIGRYGGLVEEKIDYPVTPLKPSDAKQGRVILAGQTCDSNDVIYRECFNYQLPMDLKHGDKVVLENTGVYTTTYSTVLNGFPQLKCFTLPLKKPITKSAENTTIYPDAFLANYNDKNIPIEQLAQKGSIELCDTEECGKGVRALKPYKRGEVIGSFTGMVTSELLQHSLQVEPGLNIVDPHFIGYLLHDCSPTCSLDMHQQKVYALKDIPAGSYLSMDYASTEDTLFNQFPCMCDSPNCRMWVTGRAEDISEEGLAYLEKNGYSPQEAAKA